MRVNAFISDYSHKGFWVRGWLRKSKYDTGSWVIEDEDYHWTRVFPLIARNVEVYDGEGNFIMGFNGMEQIGGEDDQKENAKLFTKN